MYLTHTSMIRGLSKSEYSMLREMCRYSNNLYNVALYNIRQYFFREKKFLTFESNYHECKTNENYGLLQAGVSQQILKVTDRSLKSFFNLIKKAKTGDYRFKDIKIPHYREKGGMFNLILSTNAINIKDRFFTVPISREFAKLHEKHQIKIPFPIRQALSGLCERYGMQYKEQEESYTSKASFLDLGEMQIYKPEHPYQGAFRGKRIKRGLYRFADGITTNADINGASNILRKSKQNFNYERLCKGLLASPLRIREPFGVET